jgi:hypothetical protein
MEDKVNSSRSFCSKEPSEESIGKMSERRTKKNKEKGSLNGDYNNYTTTKNPRN